MSTIKEIKPKKTTRSEPASIAFLRACHEGSGTVDIDPHLEKCLLKYELVTAEQEVTSKGKVLLEEFEKKSFRVLLFSEESFPWLRANPRYIRFADGKITLKVDDDDSKSNAIFLVDLGIAIVENEEYIICDEYAIEFLNRFERNYSQGNQLLAEGQSPPSTYINVKVEGTFNLNQVKGDVNGSLTQVGSVDQGEVNVAQDNSEIT